jgi:hypothetical protein
VLEIITSGEGVGSGIGSGETSGTTGSGTTGCGTTGSGTTGSGTGEAIGSIIRPSIVFATDIPFAMLYLTIHPSVHTSESSRSGLSASRYTTAQEPLSGVSSADLTTPQSSLPSAPAIPVAAIDTLFKLSQITLSLLHPVLQTCMMNVVEEASPVLV